jgi:hypothetical protein
MCCIGNGGRAYIFSTATSVALLAARKCEGSAVIHGASVHDAADRALKVWLGVHLTGCCPLRLGCKFGCTSWLLGFT